MISKSSDIFFYIITSFNYITYTEIHGYDIKEYIRRFGNQPGFVCRASLFGGTKKQIIEMTDKFYTELKNSIDAGFIGTEESIYTILSLQFPDKFNRYLMPSGDIKHYLNTLR